MSGKRLIALLVAAVMLLVAGTITAIAEEETYGITVANNTDGKLALQCYASFDDALNQTDPKTQFAPGAEVAIRVLSTDPSYTVSSLKAKTSENKTVSLNTRGIAVNDRTYTMTMPSKDVTLTLEAKPLETFTVKIDPVPEDFSFGICESNDLNTWGSSGMVKLSDDGTGNLVYGFDPSITSGKGINYQFSADGYYPLLKHINWPNDNTLTIRPEAADVVTDIDSPDDLQRFAESVNKGYVYSGDTVSLNMDLDLAGLRWKPIGTLIENGQSLTYKYYFEGTFLGNGHTIRNMNCQYSYPGSSEKHYDGGLFKGLANATVRDLVFETPVVHFQNSDLGNIPYNAGAGALAGVAGNSTIDNVTVNDPTIDASFLWYSGGLVGYINGTSTVTNCHVNGGSVTATGVHNQAANQAAYAGGFAGLLSNNALIEDCSTSADVTITSTANSVGGLLGAMYGGEISRSFATGDVTVTKNGIAGGLVGSTPAYTKQSWAIRDCYASGNVTGISEAGGLIGDLTVADDHLGQIECCYASGAVSAEKTGQLVGSVSNYRWSGANDPDSGKVQVASCFALTPENTGTTAFGTVTANDVSLDYAVLRNAASGETTLSEEDATSWKTYEDAGWSPDVWSIREPGTYPVLVPGEAGAFSVRLEADKTALTEGETIGLKAVVENGTGNHTYKFIVYNQTTNQWYRIQDFSGKDTCSWYSGPAGEKMLYVDVKAEDGTVTRAGLPVTVTARTPFVLSSSSGNVLPQKSHTLLTVSGDDLENYTYKFIVYNKTTQQWYRLRDFGNTTEFDWYTGPVGEKVLYVDVKDSSGSVIRTSLEVTVSEGEVFA